MLVVRVGGRETRGESCVIEARKGSHFWELDEVFMEFRAKEN